jgi:ribonuclease Z
VFDVIPLGVGGAMPTPTRHLSATLVRRENRGVLMDCGEGTQLQLVRGGLTRVKLDAVCITHLHGDHLFGLPGLLSTLAMLERTAPLTVVAPVGLRAFLEAAPGGEPPFEIRHVALDDAFEGVVFETAHVTVEAAPLRHRVPCWGYRYAERTRPGSADAEAAREAGVAGVQIEALKRGETVTLADGRTVAPDGIVGPPKPGGVFAYLLDTAPCDGAVALARGADLVLHDATFAEAEAVRADETGHSTARQAAATARDAGARRLLLAHFSSRYRSPATLVAEAREVFAATDAAEELTAIAVGPAGNRKVGEASGERPAGG